MKNALVYGLVAPGLIHAVLGCRCSSSKSEPTRPEPSGAVRPSPAPSASSSAGPQDSAVQPLTPPVGTVHASIVLSDPPSEHIGDQNVPPAYVVHRVRGAVIVSSGHDMSKLEDHTLVDPIEPSGLGNHTLPGANLEIGPLWLDVTDVAGSWPNDLWVDASGMWVTDGARIYGSFADTYHGVDGAFHRQPDPVAGKISERVASWSQGRLLGFSDGQFHALSGKFAVPKAAVGTSVDCPVRVNIRSVAALPSGDVYALGQGKCDDNQYLVEHWTEDSLESKSVARLPPAFATPLAPVPSDKQAYFGYLPATDHVWISIGSPTSIYALRSGWSAVPGQTRLARFDGKTWQMLGLPEDLPITDSDATADGSLWLVVGWSHGYVYTPEGGWRGLSFPKPPLPAQLDAGAPKGVLSELNSVVAFDAKRAYFGSKISYEDSVFEFGAVYSTDAVPIHYQEQPDAGAHGAGATDAGAAASVISDGGASVVEPAPFDARCTTPFVILFSVSDAAPANFAYPATRDALLAAPKRPDVKFVEFSLKRRRTLGASASTAEQAKALVQLISDRVKGSKPTLVCYAPTQVIRELKF